MSEMETTPFGASHHVWTDSETGYERVGAPILHFEDDQKCAYCGAPSTQLVRWAFTTYDVLVCDEHGLPA